MNISQAKNVLNELTATIDFNSKIPLEKQMTKLFMTSLLGKGIIAKASLKGKVISFFRGKINQTDENALLFKTIALAFNALKQTPNGLDEYSLSVRTKIFHVLDRKNLLEQSLNPFALSNIELNQLKEMKESANLSAEEIRRKLSILRIPIAKPTPLSLKLFNQLFSTSESDESQNLLFFSEFLKKNPHLASPQLHQWLPLIKQGKEYSLKLAKIYKGLGNSSEKRKTKIKETAREMASQVHQLMPTKNWIFFGTFGRKISSLSSILSFINHLPRSISKELPKSLLDLINNQNQLLLSPEQFIQEKLHGISEKIQEFLSDKAIKMNSPSWSKALFNNESRQLPEAFGKHFPELIGRNFESWMKQGLIGNAMEFFADGPCRELLLWLGDNGDKLGDPESRQPFCNEIEAFLAKSISDPLGKGVLSIENGLEELSKKLKHATPLNLHYLIGGELFSYPFWLNFEKQENGKYTVQVYTSGIGFQFLKKNKQNTHFQWPLCITDVEEANLSEAFFERLLLHHIEPQYNQEFPTNPANLFEGLLQSLQGTIQNKGVQKNEHNLDDNELAEHLLVHPSQSVRLVKFKMLYGTFLHFCQPLLNGPERQLLIKDEETAQALEKGITRLLDEAGQLGTEISANTLTALEATQSEIRQAIVKRAASLNKEEHLTQQKSSIFPPSILEGVNQLISGSDLENAKETLLWAFGDDFEEPLDALISSLKNHVPSGSSNPIPSNFISHFSKDRPKGWLRTILFSVYWHLTILAIKTAICFHQSFYTGFSYLAKLGYPYLIDKALPSFPEPVQKGYLKIKNWLEETQTAIRNLVLGYLFQWVYFLAVPKEKREILEGVFGNFRENAVNWSRFLIDKNIIDLTTTEHCKKAAKNIAPSFLDLRTNAIPPLEKKRGLPNFSKLFNILSGEKVLVKLTQAAVRTEANPENFLNLLKDWRLLLKCFTPPLDEEEKLLFHERLKGQKNKNEQALGFLFEVIASLPFPTLGHDSLWDEIKQEEILPILEEMNQLSIELSCLMTQIGSEIEQTNHGKFIASMYTLLAITDKLAKKEPDSGLEGYQTNGYSFLEWFKERAYFIKEPCLVETFQKIAAYFTPQIDLANLPKKRELLDKAKQTLFYFPKISKIKLYDSYITKTKSKLENTLSSLELETFLSSTPYMNYLQPYLDKLKAKKDLPFDVPDQLKIEDVSEEDWLGILIESSFIFDSPTPIPKAFSRLQLQALLSLQSLNSCPHHRYLSSKEPGYPELKLDILSDQLKELTKKSNYHVRNIFANRYDQKPKRLQQQLKDLSDFCSVERIKECIAHPQELWGRGKRMKAFIPRPLLGAFFPPQYKSCFARFYNKIPIHYKKSSQTKIMADGIDQRQIIRVEKEDQIVRTIAYFKENKDALTKYSNQQLFNWLIFKEMLLKKQLQESPMIAEAIGEFLTENLNYFFSLKDKTTFCFLAQVGIKLKKYCAAYAPDQIDKFPDFSQRIEAFIAETNEKSVKEVLYVLDSLTYEPGVKSRENLMQGAKLACRARFQSENIQFFDWFNRPRSNASSGENQIATFRGMEMVRNYRNHFQKWLPKIEELMQNPNDQKELVEYILKLKGIEKIPQGTWVLNAQGCYELENITIDLIEGKIEINEMIPDKILSHLKEHLSALGLTVNDLAFTTNDPNVFKTADGKLEIKIEEEQNKRLKILRTYQGKSYLLIENTHSEDRKSTYWLEQTNSTKKRLLMFQSNQLTSVSLVEQPPNSSGFKYQVIKSVHVKDLHGNRLQLEPLESSYLPGLLSLRKFCPQLECLKNPQKNQLSEINFPSYKLNFKVQENSQGLRAMCEQIPGYYIASNQSHAILSGFPAALLLQNDHGQLKVIIPANHWLPSLISRFTNQLGPVLANIIAFKTNDLQNGDSYFTYDLKESALTSDHPTALLYLTLLYLILNKIDLAEQAADSLLELSKQQLFPANLDTMMIFLSLFPPGNIQIRRLRQKIMAAWEENRILQGSLKVKNVPANDELKNQENEDTPNYLFSAIFSAILLMDLNDSKKDRDPRYSLRDDQEWFLFQSFFYHTSQLAALSEDGSKWRKMVKKIGWENLLPGLLFPQKLQQRYQQLKQKFGQEDSMLGKVINLGAATIGAESTIPNFKGFIEATSVKLSGGIKSVLLPLENERLEYGSNLFTLVQSIISMFMPKNQLKETDINRLCKEMQQNVEEKPPLEFENLSTETVVKYFLSYYNLAASHHEGPEKSKLKKLLPLIKGGWNPLSSLLIEYLIAAMDYPLLFTQARQVVKTLKESREEKKTLLTIPVVTIIHQFFNSLDAKTKAIKNFSSGSELALKGLSNMAISWVNNEALSSMIDVGEFSLDAFFQTIRWMDKFRTAWNSSGIQPEDPVLKSQINPVSPSEPNYQVLKEEDQKFLEFFTELHQQTFEILPDFHAAEDVKPFAPKSNKLAEVNNSLTDYYARKDREPPYIRLKSQNSLWDLYIPISTAARLNGEQLEKEEKAIVEMVNYRSGKLQKPLSFDDLRKFYIKGELKLLQECIHFSPAMINQLELAISRYLVKKTRLQQMERVLNLLDEISKVSKEKEPQIYAEKIEKLASELKPQRAYQFDKLPARLIKTFLMFEYTNQIMLWVSQAARMRDLLADLPEKSKNAVIELLMSLGKTFFCGPTISHYEANGSQILFNVFPSQMFDTFSRQGISQSKKTFNQSTNVFEFQRSSPVTLKSLQALIVVLARALEEGESFNATREDCQSLELMLVDCLYRCAQGEEGAGKGILELKTILNTIRQFGKLNGDEAHDLLNEIDWLNWPIGASKTLSPPIYLAIEACTKALTSDAQLLHHIQTGNWKNLKNAFDSDIVPLIAKQLACYKHFKIKTIDQKQEFIGYVSGKTNEIPDWISKNKRFSEIAMVKGVVTVFLPLVLDKMNHVDFGDARPGNKTVPNPSIKDDLNGEHAYPYNGNCSQKEGAFICSPFEAHVKTHLMLLQTGLKPFQIDRLLEYYKSSALKEAKVKQIPQEKTEIFEEFSKICPGYDLAKIKQTDYVAIGEHIRMNPIAILTYAREFVADQIKYWPENLRSNAQNFSSQFHSQIFSTGTPYNSGVYPANLKMMYDPGTIGEALHIIEQKCPKNGIHHLQSSKPVEILDETLSAFFKEKTDFTALIDGGAQLTGLDTEFVARRIADFAASHRPDIEAIDFFIQDRLVTLILANKTIIEHTQCKIPLEKRLSYFDQVHGFAANIPQKSNGKGLLLLGPNHNLFQMLQEIFRMRGVKIFKKLAGIGDEILSSEEIVQANMKETQTIHFALTPATRQVLPQNPTLRDIIELAAKNEDEMTKMRNYRAFPAKVYNVIRRAVLDKIYGCNNLEEMLEWFKEFKKVLVWKVEDDPKILFGLIESMQPTLQVLKATCMKAYLQIKNSRRFSSEEKEKVKREIFNIPIPPMPEKVSVSEDGKKLNGDLREDIGKEITLSSNQDVNNENENEDENENENEMQQQVNNQKPSSRYVEWPWSKQMNPYSTDWIQFSSPFPASSSLFGKMREAFGYLTTWTENSTPPLFKANDLLSAHTNKEMRELAPFIDERIWMSNNFLPQKHQEYLGSTCQIGSHAQRELFEVLIYLDESNPNNPQLVSVGCLSQKDMAEWRKKFKTWRNEGVLKAALYDTKLRKIVAGDAVDLSKLKQTQDFLKLESQLKFLNGEESYEQGLSEALSRWIEQSSLDKLYRAFKAIHHERGKRIFHGSTIDCLFQEIQLKLLQ